MKKLKNIKKERGAIAVMTAVMLTVLLMFTALSIDIGLHHYLGAKLQNAADAAATAVGQKIEANETNLNKCAYEYLAKNGYDNKGKYKDKIKADVNIKGVVDGSFYESTSESDEYLDYCLVKVTVDVDDSTLFANAMGISSLHLKKTAYVAVKPNYESMPEALKYSIFAGAEMGDKDTSSDDANAVISAENPAMDLQGSTGAGSGETAFSSVVAVAENTINGVYDFINNVGDWMNSTFGTSFNTDHNDLVSINVSEAVMNNDAHSNGNIMIGVQALNAARSKDSDHTGDDPNVAAENDHSSTGNADTGYIQSVDSRYNARTDADDYGSVTFSAVDTIDFGYSRYAQQRANEANQAAQASNILDQAGHTINWALNSYLESQPEKTRVFVQNQQNVQIVQHIINILNEMDLDNSTSGSFSSGNVNDGAGDFELAAKRYFRENNAVSTQIQDAVLRQETNLTFQANPTRAITLNSQESIVYRINQKKAGEYLDAYAALEVDTSDVVKERQSRLAILTAQLASTGYDKMYKNNNSAEGYVYAHYADTDGGTLGESQTENIVLERYELNGKSVPKGTKNASLKYTYSFTVGGNKVNRNLGKVEKFTAISTQADRAATDTGARYAITRTFKEKSDYIEMPNLAPYFTRQINKSIRAATKKRGQFTDGKTKGSRNVQAAVAQAQGDLEEVLDEVKYTDDTYLEKNDEGEVVKDSSGNAVFDDNYAAKNNLFQYFKVNKNSGLTKLSNNEQSLGGVNISNHSYKGYELYNSEGQLKNAIDYVNEYDTNNLNNNWFGHNKVNDKAEGMKFQNKEGTQEKNSVGTKKDEIKNEYGDDGPSTNKSFNAEKNRVNSEITSVDKYNIEDITGEGGAVSVSEKVLSTPTNPIATIDDNNGLFFKSVNSKLFGTANTFETELNTNQVSDSDTPNTVADSDVNIPVSIDSPYSDATISYPSAYTTAISSIPSTDAFSLPVENQDGWKWEAWVNGDNSNWELKNKKIYGIASDRKIKKSLYVNEGNTSFIFGYMDINANGKSLDLKANSTLYVNGDIDIRSGGSGHIDFRTNSKLYTTGFIWVQSGSSWDQRQLKKGAYAQVGKFYRSGAGLDVGEENATASEKSTLICSGVEKLDLTIDNVNYHCGYAVSGSTTVWQNSELQVNGDMVNENDSGYLLLKSNSKVVVNGSLLERKGASSTGIYVESGAVLYVKDNITLWENKIENYGTIICGGTITSRKGDLVNNGTIIAGSISVGSGTTRWLYNNGTIKTTGDIWVNGQFLNNSAKSNISTYVAVGGNLTTVDRLYNNPGNTYTSGSSNPDAEIHVNGNMSIGGYIDNNYSNNPSGSRGFIYVGGRLYSSNTLTNYEKSYVFCNGEIAPASIYNSANCQLLTNANISTGNIENCSGGFLSAKTGLVASSITNYAQMYSGSTFKVTGSFTSSGLVRAAGNFDFGGTVSITHSIFTCGGAVIGSGQITCVNLTARNGITASSLSFTGNVKTNGNVTLSSNLTIGSSSNFTIANGRLSANSITNNNNLVVNGNITASGTITNYKDILCFGNINSTGSLINGRTDNRAAILKCKGTVTVGASGYLENYNKMYVGRVTNTTDPSDVAITVRGRVSTDESRSIRNYGDILVAGSIHANSVLYSYGGNIYVYGDIEACNSNWGNNLLEMKGSTRIFVHGCVTSSDSAPKRIWMYDVDSSSPSPNTVLSIYGVGKGNNDCFGNKLEVFCNQQQGSNVYLNSKLYLSGAGSDSDSYLQNAGRLYVNGEINCPNLKSAWLTGSYDYGKTLAEDYVEGTYDSNAPKYSGLTYCKGCLDAPNATINIGDKHFVFVEDALTENFDGTGTLNVNINVKHIVMWGESMFYAPNEADITDTIDVSGTAIFNVQNQVNAQGTNVADGSGGQIVAPVEVNIVDGEAANLSGLSNVVFNRDISTTSLRGSRVEIKIVGNLIVTGPINLTRSRLIVTGKIECQSMTLNASKVQCGDPTGSNGTLTIATGSSGGALTMTNGSRMNVQSNLVKVGAISEDNSGLFVKGEISTATSITLTNGAGLITRNTEKGIEGNHNNNINLGGATTLSSGSKLFIDGKLNTSTISVNGASTLYAYTGTFFSSTANINIDTEDHRENNSKVFFGEANTRDDIQYNLYVNGTLYLPPNRHYGKNTNSYTHVDIRNDGIVVCDGTLTTDWIQVGTDDGASESNGGKALLYVAGRTTLKSSCSYTSYGRTWAYGGTDIGAARTGGKNDPNFPLKDGGEIYMGEIYSNGAKTGTWNYGYYEGHGNVFIDGNLNVTNYSDNSDNKVGNRGTAMYVKSGMTYVSGNVTLCNDNAFRSMEGAGLVCQKDFKVGCTIWNFGKLHIYGSFTMDNSATYITDNKNTTSNPAEGWSFRNGWEEGRTDASFIAYNYGNKGPLVTFKGYFKNAGNFWMNYGLSVEGYCTESGVAKDYAFVGYVGSDTQLSGEFRCNGNRFFNKWNTSFGCDGRLSYGEIALNCGQMYVGGDLLNGYNSEFSTRTPSDYRDNAVGWLNIGGSDSRSFSFMNGAYKVSSDTSKYTDSYTWKNASLFVGGNFQIGNYESEHKAGTVLNVGTMYTRGYFKVYSYGGDEGLNTGPSFYQTAIALTNESNTFIGGECYSGAAMTTGKNSIFMCDGDLRVRRPLKVNMWYKFYDAGGTAGNVLSYFEDEQYKGKGWLGSDDDGYRSCYLRVGGNVYANVEGRDLENWAATSFAGDVVPYDHSRDIDIQSNANIVIGGSFYCPQKLYLKQNVCMIICGQGESLYDNSGNLNWKCRALDELSDQKNNPLAFGPDITAVLKGNLQNLENRLTGERCSLFAYMLLDMNICSKLVVNGNAFVRDTCKIRDMTKTYIYGDMIAKDYLEVGKSLSDDSADATEARLEKYKKSGENDTDYVFSNAGYMYVQGNLTSKKYTKIYASTTVKVGGDMQAGDWTQIIGNPYITLRHDARVFVGGNMRAYSSIDSGAYSEMYVRGNVTAYTQNIKLRDQMTCYIGGSLTAPKYIELGKYDDNFYRGVKSARVQKYLTEAGDNHADERDEEQGTVTDGGEFGYNGDEHERTNTETSSDAGNDNQTEGESSASGDQMFISQDADLENDSSDLAVGSEYYIGGNIISFTSYIQEYAYSRIASGGYVVSLQHITLRHNADMWVLPEIFGNVTYHETDFEYPDNWDATLLSTLVTKMQAAMHSIKQDFEPKPGSIYSLGQLSMNTNTSIFGTYDTMVFGQTVMRKSSLVFMGHDFDCWAPVYTIQSDTSSWSSFWDSMANNLGLGEKDENGEPKRTYKGFDSYDSTQDRTNPKPIVIYANNEINVATTARFSSTYFIANRGNVNFTNLNFASETSNENATVDAKTLPNGFASYQGDVNFYALRGALGALMYAPAGNVDLDGFAYNFYGSIVGDTVDVNTFYIKVHRFSNWRSMDLHVATSEKVHLISERKYKQLLKTLSSVDDSYIYGYEKNPDPSINEWAQPFFPGLKDEDDDETPVDDSSTENLSGNDDS